MNIPILSRIGKLYLQLRLRKRAQIQQELKQKYEGQFRNVGLVLLFDLLMALVVATLVAVSAAALYLVAS